MEIKKNRNKEKAFFANINLLGKCNLNCRWCLGKDLSEFYKHNQQNTHFSKWKNFDDFLNILKEDGIEQIYITGQNTDSLLYVYLRELIAYLQEKDFYVGIRTNGVLAMKNIRAINMTNTLFGDSVSYTVLSLNPNIHKLITGSISIPDWPTIFNSTHVPFRCATVIDRYNCLEFNEIVNYLAKFPMIKYLQVRCISTDNRIEQFKEDIQAYHTVKNSISAVSESKKTFKKSNCYSVCGMQCFFWETVKTDANSYNYYTDGVISKEYFIIEGYLKNIDTKYPI